MTFHSQEGNFKIRPALNRSLDFFVVYGKNSVLYFFINFVKTGKNIEFF